jgi:hypothetical protein
MINLHQKVKPALKRVACKTKDEIKACGLHHAYTGAHVAYFTFVFLEAHGMYAWAGGALLVLFVLNMFFHFENESE